MPKHGEPDASDRVLELHDAFEAVVGEGFQDGAAGLLSKAGHPVVLAAVLAARGDVHPVGGMDGRVLVKVVVGTHQDPAPVAHGYRVRDVLSVGDVEEAGGHPGNQILKEYHHSYRHVCIYIYISAVKN